MKAQHEGALTPCIVQKNPQVTNTVQQVVCHPVNNSTGKWSSIPPHKTRPDFLYQLCRETAIRVSTSDRKPRRGNMRFLPPLEMRLSSIAPNPVESREAPPNSTVPLTSQRHPVFKFIKFKLKILNPHFFLRLINIGNQSNHLFLYLADYINYL